jgi:hypothetical protein
MTVIGSDCGCDLEIGYSVRSGVVWGQSVSFEVGDLSQCKLEKARALVDEFPSLPTTREDTSLSRLLFITKYHHCINA